MKKKFNKTAYGICFLISFTYFGLLCLKMIDSGEFYDSPITSSILLAIALFALPHMMYERIVKPFIKEAI